LHKPLRSPNALELAQPSNIKLQTSHRPSLPISLPTADNWLLKIIAIENRFVLGLYRREMKAISYLGKIEKQFGGPATTRNWNTIEKVMKILGKNSPN
jgi:hypothetical protein